jgi:hypothetical protein
MTRAFVAMPVTIVAALLGCSSAPKPGDEGTVNQVIRACSAGITAGRTENFQLSAAFLNALKTGQVGVAGAAGLDSWIHGYIFEHLPPDQREKAYEEYLNCRKQMTAEQDAYIDPPLVPLKEHSQTLWNDYAEALRLQQKIPVSRAAAYRNMGDALHALDSAQLNLKSEVMRREREALMYNISAAILADAAYLNQIERKAAIGDTDAAIQASRLATAALSELLKSSSAVIFGEWVSRQKMETLTESRLADALALRYYLTGDRTSLVKLNSALASLPCDFVQDEKLLEDPIYARLKPAPPRLQQCAGRDQTAKPS